MAAPTRSLIALPTRVMMLNLKVITYVAQGLKIHLLIKALIPGWLLLCYSATIVVAVQHAHLHVGQVQTRAIHDLLLVLLTEDGLRLLSALVGAATALR